MSPPYETSHKKVRLIGPRLSDHANHADGANAVDPRRDHAVDGRFRKGNSAAKGKGAKRAARNLVPAKGMRIYESILVQLGGSGGTIATLHAADATRHHLDAVELNDLARAAGLGTPEGERLHTRAQKSSELALRSVTAAPEASRLFKRPGIAKRGKAGTTPPGFETEDGVETEDGGTT